MMRDEDRIVIVGRAKAELRKRMRGLRQTTPASACGKRSERIVERLREMDVVVHAQRIALFWPIEERHEVDLRALDADLRTRGASVAYPSLDATTGQTTFRVADVSELVDEALGFRGAPPSAKEPGALDAIIVPSIALDERGNRLGYGAGFYDRALPRFASAIKIGVAYDFQLLVEVPTMPNDVPMDFVVTDVRVIAVEKN